MNRWEAGRAGLIGILVLGVFAALPGCGRWNKPAQPPVSTTTVSASTPSQDAAVVATGSKLAVTFSEPMDPATINAATFTLETGGVPVVGTVSYSGVTAIFTPGITGLLPNTLYTATITTGARDLTGLPLAGNYSWSFTTGNAADTVRPKVSSTNPADGATAVPTGNKLSVFFSEAMDPDSISAVTITLKRGTSAVAGVVSYSNGTAVFAPSANLASNTLYTATVGTGVKDLGGNFLAAPFTWTFSTGTLVTGNKPVVVSTLPATGALGVPTGTQLSATFSLAMDPLSITTTSFTLKQGTLVIPGTVVSDGVDATFTPRSALLPGTLYSASIGVEARDLGGNTLAAPYVWSFTTGAGLDLVRPTVTLASPADTAINVPSNSKITVTFSEPMDPQTITTATFQVAGIEGTVTYNTATRTATFTPLLQLAPSTTFTATVSSGAKDAAGNGLTGGSAANPWNFSTAATPVVLPVVNLLSVAPFGAAGGTGVTSCGNTVITGDVSTTSASTLITGLTDANGLGNPYSIAGCPGIVNGTVFTAPPAPGDAASFAVASQAQVDAQIAYDATSRASMPGGVTQTAELGGLTLAPGIYWTGSSFAITSVDLTLDAKGDPNASWVFQSDSTLTVGTNVKVVLSNGAQAKNVFWHIASAATINAGAQMKGTILAFSGVSLGTGARLDGRAISLVGGPVTLLNNIIVIP
jgi:methionine-rich copper-binding protein CopC